MHHYFRFQKFVLQFDNYMCDIQRNYAEFCKNCTIVLVGLPAIVINIQIFLVFI